MQHYSTLTISAPKYVFSSHKKKDAQMQHLKLETAKNLSASNNSGAVLTGAADKTGQLTYESVLRS